MQGRVSSVVWGEMALLQTLTQHQARLETQLAIVYYCVHLPVGTPDSGGKVMETQLVYYCVHLPVGTPDSGGKVMETQLVYYCAHLPVGTPDSGGKVMETQLVYYCVHLPVGTPDSGGKIVSQASMKNGKRRSYAASWQWPGSEGRGVHCLCCCFDVVEAINRQASHPAMP